MATSNTGSKIAAPQIFTSDPLEQSYAKGTLDPDMGGIAYAYMNAARGRREDNQNEYMQALREANLMSSRLAIHESDQELLKEFLKSQAEMANAGVDVSTMSPDLTKRLYPNVNDPRVTQPSFLSRDLKSANAAKARAEAAHAGDAGADTTTVVQNVGPGGMRGDVVITGKGKNAGRVLGTVNDVAGTYSTVPKLNPDGTVPTVAPGAAAPRPSIPDARAAASAANASGQAQRAAEAKARAEAQRTQQQLQQVR